ncbi:energy transducer TonB [Novosphingobium beihaiensis]|uniref:Protein TonB n=1 Tax=Novosphingobium beihaiensis TaxID=2930389 RepID=A0ABT0BPB7_9SPHN|nr:energy transducer TonB [Novosphingobium beihaiensis]MCJ2186894.1 energy transducer TonB [Novosphingobium beihaiensis]
MATLATTGFHAGRNRKFPQTARESAVSQPAWTAASASPKASDEALLFESAVPYERSVYQPSRRSGPIALVAAAGTVLAMLAGLMTLNMVSKHQERARLTVMTVRELDTKPKAAPPPKTLEKAVETPTPAFVPKPKIQLPAPGPVKVALDAPPPPAPIVTVAAPPPVKPVSGAAPASSASAAQDGGDLSGKALFIKPPAYPRSARLHHEQGTVKLLVLVGPDGRVDDIEIAASSGSKALDRAALKAVKEWRWEPMSNGGAPTAVRGYVVIPFVLKSKDA